MNSLKLAILCSTHAAVIGHMSSAQARPLATYACLPL